LKMNLFITIIVIITFLQTTILHATSPIKERPLKRKRENLKLQDKENKEVYAGLKGKLEYKKMELNFEVKKIQQHENYLCHEVTYEGNEYEDEWLKLDLKEMKYTICNKKKQVRKKLRYEDNILAIYNTDGKLEKKEAIIYNTDGKLETKEEIRVQDLIETNEVRNQTERECNKLRYLVGKKEILVHNFLIEVIMDPNQIIFRKTAEHVLCLAAKYGCPYLVKFLLSQGVKKMQFTTEGHTPLSLAVCGNHMNVVKILFENWMDPNYIENPNKMNLSPIFNVKSLDMLHFLIEQDTVTDTQNEKRQTPLFIACSLGLLELVKFFVLHENLPIYLPDKNKRTPLCYALEHNHHDVTNFLLQNNAHCACYFSHTNYVDLISVYICRNANSLLLTFLKI